MTISIEAATIFSLLTFVLGFFSNLIAMRKMFLSKSEFSDFKEGRDRVWGDHEKERIEFRHYVEKMCETRRASCAPIQKSIEAIERDINELYQLMREHYGRLERVAGQLERIGQP